MNGVRSTFMRRGYLLTALSALLLLAASAGTAEAQRVSIGFVETSGAVSETAFLDATSLAEPQRITVRVQGLLGGTRRAGDVTRSLGEVRITPNAPVRIATFDPSRGGMVSAATAGSDAPYYLTLTGATAGASLFAVSDEVVLVVAQSAATDGTSDGGVPDSNWVNERIEFRLEVNVPAGTAGRTPASASPDTYTLTVEDVDVAPVAEFDVSDFTLAEDTERMVKLDIEAGARGARIPPTAASTVIFDGNVNVRVSNHRMVATDANGALTATCPTDDAAGSKAFAIDLTGGTGSPEWTAQNFGTTGVLSTQVTIAALASTTPADDAVLTIKACGDTTGFRDPQLTLTVMESSLDDGFGGFVAGNISAGPALTITAENSQMVPTLSFSPTDVTIDEGGSTETVLLAEGDHADQVGMVKLMVEGDAMVSLMHDGEMLEEMGGYVTVDLGDSNSARLMAMSHESRELQDGDMAYKAWKLVDGSTDATIGEGSWFKVDVRGSTAVPALPLIGQLLLALFLMAGGSRLYRRRRG